MKAKTVYLTITAMVLCLSQAVAQDVIYTAGDSISLEEIARKHSIEKCNGERIIDIAKEFIGEKYVAGTLETQGEPLYISRSNLDCTTFVETVLALFKSVKEGGGSFSDICRNLEKTRYRDGIRNGYTSRLHYISWWIDSNSETLKEISTRHHTATQQLTLNFMSTHPDKYPALARNAGRIDTIAGLEKPYLGIEVRYIPKEKVPLLERSEVKEGDIIAIVTAIEGLDVSHMGFAIWHGESLHMIHASSQKGIVINDNETLYCYLKSRKHHLGIRVLRVIE